MPLLAGCEWCHLKFITPASMLRDDPQSVEYYLREKYAYHQCHLRESSTASPKGVGTYSYSARLKLDRQSR